MTGPSVDPLAAINSTPGLTPEQRALAIASLQSNTSKDPLAFTGQYSQGLTGYPGAHTTGDYYQGNPAYVNYPGYGSAPAGNVGPGGQTGYPTGPNSDPNQLGITKNSSDLIFTFQEALLRGVPWAQQTKADMVAAGLIDSNATPADVIGAYSQMVSLSAGAYAHNVYKSPQDYIDQWKAMAQHDAAQPVTSTQTSTSRTVYNPADLAAAYQQTSTQALGRRASAAEARAGGAAGGKAATPTVSRTTSTTKGHHTDRSTVTQAGAGQAAINEAMLQHAMANPEYGAFQAASTYFGALQQALGAVTPAGQ